MRLYRLQGDSESSERAASMEISHDKGTDNLLLEVTIEDELDDPFLFWIDTNEIDDLISFLTETKKAIELLIEGKEDAQ